MKWNITKYMAAAITFILFIGVVFLPANGLPEENGFSIADKIRSFMLVNNPEALEGVRRSHEKYIQDVIAVQIESFRQTHGPRSKLEAILNYLPISRALLSEDSFCFYPLITDRYAKQYADSFAYDSLIDSKKIWTIPMKTLHLSKFCYEDKFGEYESLTQVFDQETIDFLKDPEKIEQMVKEEIPEDIVDCKIVMTGYTYIAAELGRPEVVYPVTGDWATVLYLKGTTTDYGIKIFNYESYDTKEPSNLECFKVYKM